MRTNSDAVGSGGDGEDAAAQERSDAPPASLRDVAELAGVAISSASRALSNSPSVSAELRARVAAAAQELGYRPNLLARGLRKGASLSVGFVVRDISNSLFAEIALGAEIALRERGYSMLLTNSEGRSDLDLAHLRLFRQRSVDGLLLSLADETHAPTLDELEQLRVPMVLIDREDERPTGLSAVLCDHGAGVADACDWLASLGHRRIGLVGGPRTLRPGRVCAAALEDYAKAAGFEAAISDGPFNAQHGRVGSEQLLRLPDPPTALIAGSNQILPGVLEAVRSRPDVAVVTFDGDSLLESVGRPVGVIYRQSTEIGRAAAGLLLERFDGMPPEQRSIPSLFRAPRALVR
jgi:LacI family transcriptional regulator